MKRNCISIILIFVSVILIFASFAVIRTYTNKNVTIIEGEHPPDVHTTEFSEGSDSLINEKIVQENIFIKTYNTLGDITSLGNLYLNLDLQKANNFYITPNALYLHFDITPDAQNVQDISNQITPSIAFDGKNYFVVWVEDIKYKQGGKTLGKYWLMGARITPQGKVIDTDGFPINKGPLRQWYPRVAYGKDPNTGKEGYLVVWRAEGDKGFKIYGAIVRTNGTVETNITVTAMFNIKLVIPVSGKKAVDSNGIPIFYEKPVYPAVFKKGTCNYFWPDVAFNGEDFVVVCTAVSPVSKEDLKNYGKYVQGTVVDGVVARLVDLDGFVKKDNQNNDNPLTEEITMPHLNIYGHPLSPAIAYGGGNECLITYNFTNSNSFNGELWAVKLVFCGDVILQGEPKNISCTSEPGYGYCNISSSGVGEYMAVWHNQVSSLFKASITTSNNKTDIKSISGFGPLYKKGSYPRIAGDGSGNYVTIFNTAEKDPTTQYFGCSKNYVVGAYLDQQGKFLEAFVIDPVNSQHAYVGDVCFGNNEGIVVYETNYDFYENAEYIKKLIRSKRLIRVCFIEKLPLPIVPLEIVDIIKKN